MSVLKKLNHSTLVGCIVFLLVGIIALTAGIVMFRSDQRFKNNANQIKASITDIHEYKNDDGSTSHNVYVAFNLNGVVYEGKINEYSGDMYIGKEIFVFYNIDDPSDFRTCNPLFFRALILSGLLFLLIGASPWIFALLKNAAMKRFTQNHERYGNNNKYTPKTMMLANAVSILNKPNQPWTVSVDGNNIIARWTWEEAGAVNEDAVNHFMFSVTLNDSGWWWEDMDAIATSSNYIGKGSSFYGKTYQKSFEFTTKRDKQSGKIKISKGPSMDTAMIKRAVRNYLTSNGWKRAGLFMK